MEVYRDLPNQARVMADAWSWNVTENAELLLLLWRTYGKTTLLGHVLPWTTPWSSATWHMFSWTITWRLRTSYPRSWRTELLREDGDFATHKCTFQREMRPVCTVSLRTDKRMGGLWAWFWLINFWGARELLGFMGEQGSEQECS